MNEVIAKRTLYSKTYDLGGGRFQQEVHARPVHYLRNGSLENIELTSVTDGPDELVNKAHFAIRVAKNRPAYRYTSRKGVVGVDLKRIGGTAVPPTAPTKAEPSFVWPNIAPATTYQIKPTMIGVTALTTLHDASAPKVWEWEILGDNILAPIVGFDAEGRRCELIETWDEVRNRLQVEWTGRVTSQKLLRANSTIVWIDTPTYPVIIDPTVTEDSNVDADNGMTWHGYNTWYSDAGANDGILVGYDTGYNAEVGGGIRFRTIDVPQGAVITQADITVDLRSTSGSPIVFVYADDVDDGAVWASTTNLPRDITKTAAKGSGSPSGSGEHQFDILNVVQELVDRSGWTNNNDMNFALLAGGGSTGNTYAHFVGSNFPTADPRLVIKYTALTPVNSSTDVRWDIASLTTKNTDLRWNVAALAAAAADLRWDVLAAAIAVNNAINLRWNVAEFAAADSDLRWSVATSINAAIDIRWNVNTLSGVSDLDLRWNVLTSAAANADFRWNVSALALANTDLRWNISALANANADLRWNIAALANADNDVRWNVHELANADNDLRWNVLTSALSSIDLRWDIHGLATADVDLRWSLAAAINNALDLRWGVLATAFSVTDIRWDVLKLVSANIDYRWDVLSLLSNDVSLKWDVIGAVGKAISLHWDVLQLLAANSDIRWNVNQLVNASGDLRWDVTALVTVDIDLQWALRELAQANADLRWNISQFAGDQLDTRWDVLINVLNSVELQWDVSTDLTVGSTVELRWNVRQLAGDPIDLRWSVGPFGDIGFGPTSAYNISQISIGPSFDNSGPVIMSASIGSPRTGGS